MTKLRRLFVLIFGNLSWQPPRWLVEHRRRMGLIAVITLVVAVGSWRAYDWYRKLPQPRRILVYFEPPGVTPLEKILTPRPLEVRFNDSVAKLPDIGFKLRLNRGAPVLGGSAQSYPVPTGIRIEPAVEGTWRWVTDSRLTFTPKQDWPADQEYHVTLDKSAVAPHVLLDRYNFDFSTPPFVASFRKLEFYQDPTNPDVKQVVA